MHPAVLIMEDQVAEHIKVLCLGLEPQVKEMLVVIMEAQEHLLPAVVGVVPDQ
jgi:hypothetical protein